MKFYLLVLYIYILFKFFNNRNWLTRDALKAAHMIKNFSLKVLNMIVFNKKHLTISLNSRQFSATYKHKFRHYRQARHFPIFGQNWWINQCTYTQIRLNTHSTTLCFVAFKQLTIILRTEPKPWARKLRSYYDLCVEAARVIKRRY